MSEHLSSLFRETAWTANIISIQAILAPLDGSTPPDAFATARNVADALPILLEQGQRLAEAIGRKTGPVNFRDLEQLALVGERISQAPEADPIAFAQDLWDNAIERAADLAVAVRQLEEARVVIGSNLNEAAWSADLSSVRTVLVTHGESFLRLFNGEWRAADRLVRSFQSQSKVPLDQRLRWLDALAKGQASLKLIRDEGDFGRIAFAGDWRGERSAPAPLQALVDWMRSLRGLGAEPRLVLGRHPDRTRIANLSQSLSEELSRAKKDVFRLWDETRASRQVFFGNATTPDEIELPSARENSAAIASAYEAVDRLSLMVEPSLDNKRQALETLARAQTAAASINAAEPIAREAFGRAWSGRQSNWPSLVLTADWLETNADIRHLAARIGNRADLKSKSDAALAVRAAWLSDMTSMLLDIKASNDACVTANSLLTDELDILEAHVAAWRDGGEALTSWVGYQARVREAEALGLVEITERLGNGRLKPEASYDDFEQAFFEAVLEKQVEAEPELAVFDGEIHNRKVRDFVDLDRQRIRLAASEVALAHHRGVPPLSGGAAGPLKVLKGEMARKRGHMPLRQLMEKAAPAIQALKPVFMMSPLSVAQFLPPGKLTFDLLVMDEASQIQPVDALGAIARSKQVVVVGDPQQLPPTAFFAKMTGRNDGDDDDGAAKVADIESILGLFTARGLPVRMLRWHYRSRHESLIAISNRQFYENKLVIIPSPFTAQSGLGLRFHHVKDGIFETGTTRTNPIEAKAVAHAIIHHARTAPNHSLGVVAFSAQQRKAILEQLELLRRQLTPTEEAFFQAHPTEPFFVKNLENVQGDERDVILISIGYGPTAPGARPPMRFGPVGLEGGERRLNVLISRAKRRCEVFSSMTDEDIDPDFASGRKGVFALKLFMHFARTGRLTLAESVGRDRHVILEEQVAQALQERGFQTHLNVGVSGLFVDIAVALPDQPDRYLLAVEFDGPSYNGAKSARDRDRLRQSVLEGQGWIVHRIWSGDWFKRPLEQLERLVAAIEAAKLELAHGNAIAARLPAYEIISVDREFVTEMGLGVSEPSLGATVPYVETLISKPAHLSMDLHQAPTGVLSLLAETVVQGEGPVHFDEVVVRLRTAWGAAKAGSRIRDAIRSAVDVSTRQGRILAQDDFLSAPGGEVIVRDRSEASSPSLRRPEMLPPAEIEKALIEVVSNNFGATEEQALQHVSRALGFKATSAQLRDVLFGVLNESLDTGILIRRDKLIDAGPNAPKSRRELPKASLQMLIEEGEGERLEFKETLRYDLRQGIVNKKIEDSSMKAIAAFSNHRGGTLLIGMRDDGTAQGLGPDLAGFGGSRDRFELHLTNLIKDRFSESFRVGCITVSYPILDEHMICRIDVKRSKNPIYLSLSDNNNSPATERLIVRAGASSPEIPLSQVATFIRDHFDA